MPAKDFWIVGVWTLLVNFEKQSLMLLLITATEMEMRPFQEKLAGKNGLDFLVVGVGPLEAAVNLTAYLAVTDIAGISGVVTVGVGGAYLNCGLDLLDICLAESEVLGDLGICLDSGIDELAADLPLKKRFDLGNDLLGRAIGILTANDIECQQGGFVTVSCVSGTAERGNYLKGKYKAICENMEGAAVARVCKQYKVSCLELRVISNLVEDRDLSRWRLKDACTRAAEVGALVVKGLLE